MRHRHVSAMERHSLEPMQVIRYLPPRHGACGCGGMLPMKLLHVLGTTINPSFAAIPPYHLEHSVSPHRHLAFVRPWHSNCVSSRPTPPACVRCVDDVRCIPRPAVSGRPSDKQVVDETRLISPVPANLSASPSHSLQHLAYTDCSLTRRAFELESVHSTAYSTRRVGPFPHFLLRRPATQAAHSRPA